MPVQSPLSGDSSDHERWATFTHAIELWRQSPILGAGLGVFIADSPRWLRHAQVIHSTPLWILAEFGLLGMALMLWSGMTLLRFAVPGLLHPTSPRRTTFMFLLMLIVMFSQAHEIFYQRILWLVLGALLASRFQSVHKSHEA